MLSSQKLSTVRLVAFAGGGLLCAGYALTALLSNAHVLPHWTPLFVAATVGGVFFVAGLLAGARNTQSALDESYQADGKTAATYGFWSALAVGTALWLLDIGQPLQLAITLNAASAVYFLTHVALDLRGRLCA